MPCQMLPLEPPPAIRRHCCYAYDAELFRITPLLMSLKSHATLLRLRFIDSITSLRILRMTIRDAVTYDEHDAIEFTTPMRHAARIALSRAPCAMMMLLALLLSDASARWISLLRYLRCPPSPRHRHDADAIPCCLDMSPDTRSHHYFEEFMPRLTLRFTSRERHYTRCHAGCRRLLLRRLLRCRRAIIIALIISARRH